MSSATAAEATTISADSLTKGANDSLDKTSSHAGGTISGKKRPRPESAADANKMDPSESKEGDEGGEWQTIRNGRPTKKLKKVPKKDSANYPSIVVSKHARLQAKIQVSDLRNLVTYIFADGLAPQWVAISHRPSFRKIVAILAPGLEEGMFGPDMDCARWVREEDGSVAALERWAEGKGNGQGLARSTAPDDCHPRPLHKEALLPALQPMADVFGQMWPVRARGADKYGTMYSPVATFLTAPLPKSAEGRDQRTAAAASTPADERTRITEFLMTPQEYLANDFVLHPAMLPDAAARAEFTDAAGWVHTEVATLADGAVAEAAIEQGSITAGRSVYAVDCEMCKTAADAFVLTRISVLAWDGEVVLDELVKPAEPIADYLTRYSGITEAMLAPVTTTLADIQGRLLRLLDARAILVGHSLDSDLRALQLTHPFIVDTSLLFPHPAGPPRKHALRWLAAKHLGRAIQRGHGTAQGGHDSIEDARTCLDLVKKKCEKGKHWAAGSFATAGSEGGAGGEGAGENLFHRLARAGTAYRSQGGAPATGGLATGKSTAAADWGDARRTLCGAAGVVLGGCRSDAEVEQGVLRAVRGDPDGAEVPGGGVDFVYARLRGLEALQGWWNRNKLAAADSDSGPPTRERLRAMLAEDKEEDDEKDDGNSEADDLRRCLGGMARRIRRIHAALPPCSVLLVFSGSGDPRAMAHLQAQRAQHKREYHTPGVKWDEISVPWTDTEEQLLKKAARRAREGVAFVVVK